MKCLACQGHQREKNTCPTVDVPMLGCPSLCDHAPDRSGSLFKAGPLMRSVRASSRRGNQEAQGHPCARKFPLTRADIDASAAGIFGLASTYNITVAAARRWKTREDAEGAIAWLAGLVLPGYKRVARPSGSSPAVLVLLPQKQA